MESLDDTTGARLSNKANVYLGSLIAFLQRLLRSYTLDKWS